MPVMEKEKQLDDLLGRLRSIALAILSSDPLRVTNPERAVRLALKYYRIDRVTNERMSEDRLRRLAR
jgi:hypothetical protein